MVRTSGDELAAARFSQNLIEYGVYAISFSYPVVPRGTARDLVTQ
jgi:7-keto-8-aminopelargonate synthetase-like enzyme